MDSRESRLKAFSTTTYDVLIVGGGINGAVSASALAANGVKVALIDKNDFASGTSSNSSNLAWGGIKYLESHEYGLVRKLCKSRNHLMQQYPSSVKEIRFLTAIQKGFRMKPLFIYLGTILYWAIGGFFTKAPKYLSAAALKRREVIVNADNVAGGFEYSDCYLYDNDARFVFSFIRAAVDAGCDALNYVESTHSKKVGDFWKTCVLDKLTGREFVIRSKVLINACGPYVDEYNQVVNQDTHYQHLFSKGIHLIVPQLTQQEKVLTFFASDGRLFFVIPMAHKTCIGTTDTQEPSPDVVVTEEDRQFVLDNANRMLDLDKPLTQADIIAERCGVRPLATDSDLDDADWVKLSRKHVLEVNETEKHISIFGGKLTDCLNVGSEVLERVKALDIQANDETVKWYGEPSLAARNDFYHACREMMLETMRPKSSAESLEARFWRRYGDKAYTVLDELKRSPETAAPLFEQSEYLQCELAYVAEYGMVEKLDDLLRRRSRLSLVLTREQIANSEGLQLASKRLFGDRAKQRLAEYLQFQRNALF